MPHSTYNIAAAFCPMQQSPFSLALGSPLLNEATRKILHKREIEMTLHAAAINNHIDQLLFKRLALQGKLELARKIARSGHRSCSGDIASADQEAQKDKADDLLKQLQDLDTKIEQLHQHRERLILQLDDEKQSFVTDMDQFERDTDKLESMLSSAKEGMRSQAGTSRAIDDYIKSPEPSVPGLESKETAPSLYDKRDGRAGALHDSGAQACTEIVKTSAAITAAAAADYTIGGPGGITTWADMIRFNPSGADAFLRQVADELDELKKHGAHDVQDIQSFAADAFNAISSSQGLQSIEQAVAERVNRHDSVVAGLQNEITGVEDQLKDLYDKREDLLRQIDPSIQQAEAVQAENGIEPKSLEDFQDDHPDSVLMDQEAPKARSATAPTPSPSAAHVDDEKEATHHHSASPGMRPTPPSS